MSHGAVHSGGGGDAITLSATSATGQGEVSVAFDYTAESLAAHDSPSGTGGFLYTVPSPSPTAPPCSLRLSGANGSGNGLQRAVRSPTAVGKGRRLEWDSTGSSSSTGSRSNSNTPVRPQPESTNGHRHLAGVMGATSPGGAGVLGSRATDCNPEGAGGAITASTRTSAQQPRAGGAAGANTATAPLLQGTPTVGGSLNNVGPVTPTRTVETHTPAAEGAGEAGAPPRGGGGLFTALLDNISLSQIMQSQGTTQGTTGTQGEHADGDAEGDRKRSSSSSSGNKPVSPSGARRTGVEACAAEKGEGDGARQQRRGVGSAAEKENGEAAGAPQDGGLWSASRLAPLGSLALLDSEDNPGPGLGLDNTDPPSIPPGSSCTMADSSACCDRRQQQQLSPPNGGGGASTTAAAEAAAPVRSSSDTALATAGASASACPSPLSPPAAGAGAAGTAVSAPGVSSSPAGFGETAAEEDGAGKVLPIAAAPSVEDQSSPVQREQPEAGLPAPVSLHKAAAGGEGSPSPAEAVAVRAACGGDAGGRGDDAAAGAVDVGAAGVAAGNGSEREESPAFSVGSSLNLALSLTPECERMAAAQARKEASAERSARDNSARHSTDSCVSSLYFELPSSVPPSNCSMASATSFMSPPPRGGVGHAAAAAAATRGDRSRGTGSSGNRRSHGSSCAAESDSPWSLRALSSAELSPVSPRQTQGFSPAAVASAPATAVGAPATGAGRTPAALSARNGSAGGGSDACDGANGEQGGVDGSPRPTERSCPPTASEKTPPATAVGVGPGETPGAQLRRARRGSQNGTPRPASLEAAGPKVPEEGADEKGDEIADGPGAEAGRYPRGAAESGSLLGAAGSAERARSRRSDGHMFSGAGPANPATGDGGGAGHVVAVSDSEPGGASGSEGDAQGSLKSGEKGASATPTNARTNASTGSTAAASSVSRELAGAAVAPPNRATANKASTSSGGGGSSEKPCFTNGAPLTNWAAGVCGRGELLSYPGEGRACEKPPGPAPAAAAAARAAAGGNKASTDGISAEGPEATASRREEAGAGEAAPGAAASLGLIRRREQGVDGGPPGRSAGEAQGSKRATSSIRTQQLAFTSEEESCGHSAPGAAGDSVITDPSPGELFATPPPSSPPASTGVRMCRREIDDLDRSSEAERAASSSRGATKTCAPGAAAAAAASAPAAQTARARGRSPDQRRREAGEKLSLAMSPPRSPVAVSWAVADKAGDALSPLVPSPDATQTPGRDGARAITLPAAEPAKPPDGAKKSPPSSSADSSRPPLARPPAAHKGKAGGGKAREVRAATTAGEDAPDPRPAAAATLVPARPSVDGWFSSRRVEGFDNSPLTACSEASLGGRGTATQSPDLLADPPGLTGATTAAPRVAGPAARGGSSVEQPPRPCPTAEGGKSERGPSARSAMAPLPCGGIPSDREAVTPRAGGVGVGVGGATADPACAIGTATATDVFGEGRRERRGGARGEKRTRGEIGGLWRTAEHARTRGAAIGGRQDPGEEGVASSPGLEIISPDDIVETPPSAAPKKRLKARKLVAAVAAATAAESVPAVTLPVAAMSEQEDEGQDGEMEEGHTVRRHGETRGKAPGEVPGRAEGERREENDETGEIEEEAEEEADLESATLTDTDTEEAAPAPQAAEEDRRHRQSRQDRQEERQRDAPAEGARENASAPPPPVGKPSEEERAAASTSGTASGRPTASGDRGRGGGSSAATRSSSHLRGGVAAPQPPVLSGPESLQSAAPLFFFWHQARVQLMLARRRRERRHASFLAARIRWNKARSKKGAALVAKLNRAKEKGAPTEKIIERISTVRNAVFRYDPTRDTSGSGSGSGGDASPFATVNRYIREMFDASETRAGGAARSSPPATAVAFSAASIPGRRQQPPAAEDGAPSLDSEHPARTSAAASPVGGGRCRSIDDRSTAVSPAVATGSAAGAAGASPAREAAGKGEASSLAGSCSSPVPAKTPTSHRRRCETPSGQRLRRAATLPSPPRPFGGSAAPERTALDGGSTVTPSSSRASSRPPSSCAPRNGDCGADGAAAADTRGLHPTADQLNDPVYRGMMKARARAAKAAAASSAGAESGLVRQSSERGFAGKAPRAGRRTEEARRENRGEQRQGCSGWMSSRRRDWALDDVCFPPAPGGLGSSSSSSSSRRLSRSKSAPCDSPSPPPPRPPPTRQPTSPPPTAAKKKGPKASTAEYSTRAPASLVGGGGGDKGGDRAAAAAGSAPTAGRGTKRGAAARLEAAGGGGDDNVAGGPGAGGVVVGTSRTGGVGPRSHAKKRSRGGGEYGREAADTVRPGSAATAAAAAAAAQGAPESVPPPPPSQPPTRTGPSVRFHGVTASAGEDSPGERSAKKGCRRRPCTRKSSATEAACLPAATSPAATTPRTRQQQRRRGPRGQEMVRQANAQAAAAGGAPVSAAERATPVGDPATAGVAVPRSGVFAGLSFVLVGLPEPLCQEVEGLIVASGGLVLEDMPPRPRDRFERLPPAGATAAEAARRGKRGRDAEGEVAVVVSVPAASRLPRYVLAIATGTPLLHHLWVSDSAAEGRALPPASYLLPGAREASRRRQALAGAARGDGGARRGSSGFGPAAAGKAGDASRAAAALAKVVTKTGTPLTGMAIGVAHPCPKTGERWAQVLSAAGAQTVRPITGDLLFASQEEASKSLSKITRSCSGGRAREALETTGRGGGDGESSPSLQAAVAGLDCVLCDYPGAWSSFSGDGGGKSGGGATPARPAAAGKSAPPPAGTGIAAGSSSSSSPASLLSSLGRVVDAGRRQDVPVVALSWAIDCVVRGSRVRQQARPEYLSPFLDDSLAAAAAASAAAGGQTRFGVGVMASPLSAISGRRAPPSAASPSRSRAARTPVRVLMSKAGVRYEVEDHVYFRAQGGGGGGGARCNAVSPPVNRIGGGRTSPDHPGGDGRHPPEMAVGRIVHLERAGGGGGRVIATLEPLQRTDKRPVSAAAAAASGAPARGMFHVGCGGGFASPSTESSVSRGRARRARELKKAVLADGTGTSSSGRQSWQKVEAGGLLGRVSVLSAREFDARRGFCGRDPDVYVQQRAATPWANPL